MKHVIIGTGPAGVIAAETLRKIQPDSEVMLIGDEPEPPYSRMALPYYLIEKIDESGTHLRHTDGHFDKQGIELVQDRVVGIDSGAKTLSMEQRDPISYDRLLLATGSHPVRPPIDGMDLPGIHACWTLEDGRNIAKKARKGSKVVLMGAGFIGCIVLEALAKRGVDLTVIEMEDRMVPRMMNQTSGGLIKKWCEAQGVAVHTSTRVESIEKGGLLGGGGLRVNLDNGETLKADLVISATGVKSNIQFLDGSGIETDTGILVNDHLQSNVDGIYAAGDVCQGRDFSTGEYTVQAIQPTAADHGRIAAMNMAGHDLKHQGSVNMNVLDTMGLISSSYGLWMGVDGGDTAELQDIERYRYISLQFQDDIMVGAQALGLTEHVGVLRGLIQTQLPLGKWKDRLMQDPTRIMEAYLGTTQAIGHNADVMLKA
ncbi:NADPH-dependent 2,4-dienoyl-CoA reductase/sulfur reductase-like enzyme [Methylohalomonas lacus]|uniref:NADPH-dependent 2,4-dienoyl-CoA reductase/sulfur reductase-like enzyme n=1 Tax=Methylohalomonas lacus TaxID=398773 RepID=A0AAE3HK29_9GAMM|nr:FAD/NAD(P)-binding oxidoreductase [Methylohalomonas lacus]MCS3902566.1 NADPH-dependent 2,4-dienoyl-CoA reductase/sulfur reductase-like enzyme [Methylohalomonas lacus]